MSGGDRRDQSLRSVATGHAYDISPVFDCVHSEPEKVITLRENDRLDSSAASFIDQVVLLDLSTARSRVHDQYALSSPVHGDSRLRALFEGRYVEVHRVAG